MTMQTERLPSLEADFWRAFGRALGHPFEPGHYRQAELAEWDSLRHVELVFELEEVFRLSIPPAAIAELFSDTDTVLAYLREHAAR